MGDAELVHMAPNYDAGGVWFRLGDKPRKLLSPSDAHAVADELEAMFRGVTPKGYDTDEFIDELRDLADEVEDKVDEPEPEKYDDIPLTDT